MVVVVLLLHMPLAPWTLPKIWTKRGGIIINIIIIIIIMVMVVV